MTYPSAVLQTKHKRTDLGLLPCEWAVVPLSDLKPFVTSGSRGWAAFYSGHGDLFVRITNLSRDSIYLNLDDCKFVTIPGQSSEKARTRLEHHDVLISITADIGIVGYIDSSIPSPAYINQHIALVRFDPKKTCGKFVSYFLSSERPQRLFRSSTDTGAKAGMSLPAVLQIQTAVPTVHEQRAIAEALSDVDALLAGLDRLIAKKSDLKQAAMQQLLTGQLRLPSFHDEWEQVEFGDVAAIRNVKIFAVSMPFGTPCVELDSLSTGGGRLHGFSESRAASLKYAFRSGDVLFGRLRAYLKKYWLATFDGICSTEIWPLVARDERLSGGFLHFLVQTNAFVEASGISYGTHMPRSDWSILRKLVVTLPSFSEQTAIVDVLSNMDAERLALEARRDKARALKQAMMQELLTGRIRLV